MTGPRIGSLFSGYGGLDLAVQAVYPDATVAWHVEFDDAPSRVLAHHWPDVPNLHDVTTVEWSTVEPVDILTGGFPCQDVSVAGRRAGMTDGTRSGLWSHMVRAIDVLRPGLVVIENVGGLFSARADSRVEPCDYHLGDADGGGHAVLLRALDSVLGTLAALGYDAQWTTLRAADVGAPHGRLRVFITAHPAQVPDGAGGRGRAPVAFARETGGQDAPAHGADARSDAPGTPPRLMPTPRATDGTKGGPNQRGSSGDLMLPSAVAQLLPTPAVNDMGASYTPDQWDEWTDRMRAEHGNGNGHGKSLSIEAQRLLPTPTSWEQRGDPAKDDRNLLPLVAQRIMPTPEAKLGRSGPDYARAGRGDSGGDDLATTAALLPTPMTGSTSPAAHDQISGDFRRRMGEALDRMPDTPDAVTRFGPYGTAVAQWERIIGRPAPDPTEPGKNRPRLAARFVEWMMGLPDGHVTGVGLTRNQQLRALGNGVVPQQGAAALAHLAQIGATR